MKEIFSNDEYNGEENLFYENGEKNMKGNFQMVIIMEKGLNIMKKVGKNTKEILKMVNIMEREIS